MRNKRKSGILLHPTSLPGPGGIGSLGEGARLFVDFLQAGGQSLWQILPLGPTSFGDSPYACYSAFAGNPLLISLEEIAADGDLEPGELHDDLPRTKVDYRMVEEYKSGLLKKAAANFFARADQRRMEEFANFCGEEFWLSDYALFMSLKSKYRGKSWSSWPETVSRREPATLGELRHSLTGPVNEHKYMQWQFFRQWRRIREYANSRGIGIIGDIPIFTAYDSADVWANPHLYHLDQKGRPTVVAGVPPDYFSDTGQLWGNPLYNWDSMAGDGFNWWIERFRHAFTLFGFEACWEVPAGEKTAVNGRWVKGPGEKLFHALISALGKLPIIAEDLGVITPEVEVLRDEFYFPGMKILQFAFGSGPDNPYLPHNHVRESVVYTGTHDNDTTTGWFALLSVKERANVCRYLNISGSDISWDLIRCALTSVADTVIIPLQDTFSLGSESRMNTPGTVTGNWSWRFPAYLLDHGLSCRLLEMTEIYGRNPGGI
jgi:4-alpha-glucanotransferase